MIKRSDASWGDLSPAVDFYGPGNEFNCGRLFKIYKNSMRISAWKARYSVPAGRLTRDMLDQPQPDLKRHATHETKLTLLFIDTLS